VPDPDATGSFCGLRPAHGRAALARAVYEGVAIAVAEVLTLLGREGVPVRELRVTAGGASPLLLRLLAAAALVPVRAAGGREGSALGAALLARALVAGEAAEDLARRWCRPGPAVRVPASERAAMARRAERWRLARDALAQGRGGHSTTAGP
jgi:sugar (pentulose or hexulose) kinase